MRRFVRMLGLLALGFSSFAGLPDNGLPDNGLPDNGLPDNGLPDNGLPDNGNSPDALIDSPLFFNAATHSAWVSSPFTAATILQSPLLRATLADPFSALVMAYQWQLCHPAGDDATVTDSLGRSHTFHGRIGLCVLRDGHGWHADAPLDYDTARWLSSATITQVNRFHVHNRYSLRGPTSDPNLPGARGDQLTAMSPSMTSYVYKFGTDQPVEAFGACPPGAGGLDACGWKPHWVGRGRPGTPVRIASRSGGVPIILQVNLGIHGANPGDTGALAVSGKSGAIDPEVDFVVPEGGTFNVQWTSDPRGAGVSPPMISASGVRLPADEVFVFTNREMYATAMLFNLAPGDANVAAIPGFDAAGAPVASCEPRPTERGVVFCDAGAESCRTCTRAAREGARQVVFPNAHMWLSSSWTNAQDYYALRSCSSNLASCVATFEGFIDARYCGPQDPRCLSAASTTVSKACRVQSVDRDTQTPRPYGGAGRRLHDALGCHIGSGPDTGYGVTTLFANYGAAGACWATSAADSACAFQRRGDDDEDDDDD